MSKLTDAVTLYLQNNKNGYSPDEIRNALTKLTGAVDGKNQFSDASLFNIEDMDEESFMSLMQNITDSSDGSLDNEISILYSILDQDGNGTVSADEFTYAFDSRDNKTSGNGNVSGFELWLSLSEAKNNSEIVEKKESSEDESPAEEIVHSEEDDESPAEETVHSEEADGTTKTTVEESIEEPTSEGKVKSKKISKPENYADRNDWQNVVDYINGFIIESNEDYDTPQEVVTALFNDGIITEQDSGNIMCAYIYSSLNPEQKKIADQYLDAGYPFETVIERMGINVNETAYYKKTSELKADSEKANEPEVVAEEEIAVADETLVEETVPVDETQSEPEVASNRLSDEAVQQKVNSLHEYLTSNPPDYTAVQYILTDIKDDSDFAKVMQVYETSHGSIISQLPTYSTKDHSIDTKEWANTIVDRLISAAKSGDETAYDVLAYEITEIAADERFPNSLYKNGIQLDPQWAFMENIFSVDSEYKNKMSDEEFAKLMLACQNRLQSNDRNNGSILAMLTSSYPFIYEEEGNNIATRLMNAARNGDETACKVIAGELNAIGNYYHTANNDALIRISDIKNEFYFVIFGSIGDSQDYDPNDTYTFSPEDEKVIKNIVQTYNELFPDSNLTEVIDNSFEEDDDGLVHKYNTIIKLITQ